MLLTKKTKKIVRIVEENALLSRLVWQWNKYSGCLVDKE